LPKRPGECQRRLALRQSEDLTLGLGEKVAQVVAHAVHDRGVGLWSGLAVLLCSWCCCVSTGWRRGTDFCCCAQRLYVGNLFCDWRLALDSSLENQSWFYTYSPYQHDELRIEIVGGRGGLRVKRQRRHENLVDRLLIFGQRRSHNL